MKAGLVYDGGDNVTLPPTMGDPLSDQFQGSSFDQLGELCSRICYDSFGCDKNGKRKGRSSDALHDHILQVDNTSVHEHQNFTVRFPFYVDPFPIICSLANRKGIFVEYIDERLEVTTNLRAILKWDRCNSSLNLSMPEANKQVRNTLQHFASVLAPKIVKAPEASDIDLFDVSLKTDDLTENQAWISLWLYGSRGFTHEQVRHRFAISQRSTRYVDESESEWILHPLIQKFLADSSVSSIRRRIARTLIDATIRVSRFTYKSVSNSLTNYNVEAGLDKTSARKQARGASRGYLGNALASEMIFSASAANWIWILSQRKNKAADAEIREIYTPALAALQSSRYGNFFSHFKTGPSPDGIGTVLV